MLGWFARILLVIAGLITSWFVAPDALNFNFVQMVVAVFIMTSVIIIAAFWPFFEEYLVKIIKWGKNYFNK